MKVISRTRRMGKTTDLLELAIAKGLIFVCHDTMEVKRLEQICKEAKLDPPKFMTFEKFISREWLGMERSSKFVIDNVDMLLERIAAPFEIVAVALNQGFPDVENQ